MMQEKNTKVPTGKRYVCNLIAFESGQEIPVEWRGKGRLVALPTPPPAPTTMTWRQRQAQSALARGNAQTGRLLDDLVDALVAKGMIKLTDLPTQTQDALKERKTYRRELEVTS